MSSTRLVGIASRAALDTIYLTIGGLTAVLGFGVWVSGLIVSLTLLPFVIGLPVILVTAIAFRWTAELDRRNAVLVLDEPLRGRYRDHRGARFFARLGGTLRDGQTWRDLTWLVLHSVIGFGFGVAAVSLVANTLAVAVLPLWYWAVPDGVDWGIWTIDSLPEAFLVALAAIPCAAITVGLLRLMALGEANLAAALLAPRRARDGGRRVGARTVLAVYAALAALVASGVTVTWALTTGGSFWAGWVWLGLALPVALWAAARHAAAGTPPGRRRGLAVYGAITGVLAVTIVIVWWLSSSSYFWAIWPLLGLGFGYAVVAVLLAFWDRLSTRARERQLAERVDVLTRTRRGALDVQAAELRRIERDLHDGAQARLVALSMQLGRAEERLEDKPEIADLVRQARGEASAAIAELRDLARGIAPPVLADRGLEAAVEALGRRSAIPVTVDAHLERRPVPVIETAAYFVVAEALTNAAKHAGGAPAHVTIRREPDRLVVEVTDAGPGGADPDGGGLTGLRHRVEALDGILMVISPPGAGTTIHAELPAAS